MLHTSKPQMHSKCRASKDVYNGELSACIPGFADRDHPIEHSENYYVSSGLVK